jgi:hypothetical protein
VEPVGVDAEVMPVDDAELMPVGAVELVPVMDDAMLLVPEVTNVAVDGHGLRPPGSISVAPSGIPVVADGLPPSGRVAVDPV